MVKVWAGIGCPDLALNGVVEFACVLVAAYSVGLDLRRITQARAFTVSHKGETVFGPSVPDDAVGTRGAGDAFVGRRVPSGASLAQAASAAAQYAGLICGTRGAFSPARPITREILSRERHERVPKDYYERESQDL